MKTFPRNYYIRRRTAQLLKQRPRRTIALAKAVLPRRKKHFPTLLFVEVTNHCNLACVTCPHPSLSDEKGYLSADLFRKIIDECSEFSSLASIVFTGFGEPLMHPQLVDMSRYLKSRKIPYTRTYTNCLLLNEKKTDEILFNSEFDEITLSLNAPTEETYKRITGRQNYERVTENIQYFLKRKKELRVKTPFVNLQLLELSDIPLNATQFVKKWMPLLQPGDCVRTKRPHSFAGHVNDPGVKQVASNANRVPCGQLWNSLFISWNGDVMPCCTDPLRRLKIGNVGNSSLMTLWHSPKMMHLREMHSSGQYHRLPLCDDCEIWWYFSGHTPFTSHSKGLRKWLMLARIGGL